MAYLGKIPATQVKDAGLVHEPLLVVHLEQNYQVVT
jgi:hypothetical protein